MLLDIPPFNHRSNMHKTHVLKHLQSHCTHDMRKECLGFPKNTIFLRFIEKFLNKAHFLFQIQKMLHKFYKVKKMTWTLCNLPYTVIRDSYLRRLTCVLIHYYQ